MNGDLFEGWLETVFVPCLINPEKSVLIIDNASHHRRDAIFNISDEYGFGVIFLPKYSPDFNPIELLWAWICLVKIPILYIYLSWHLLLRLSRIFMTLAKINTV